MDSLPQTSCACSIDALNCVISGQHTILDVIQCMGGQLASTDPSEREKAIDRLTDLILRLPKEFLNSSEVGSLLEFFCSKLKDSALLASPAIKTIHHLCTNVTNFPDQAEIEVLKVLLREQEVQASPQRDRILIYRIVDQFLDTKIDSIRNVMPTELILGFLQSADGERDPRCLMTVFWIFCKILDRIPLGPFASDMFEMIACYFPIDFQPPPNDPYGITPEHLALALRRCLTGHRCFANVCLDLITEKFLDEDIDVQRQQIWALLVEALETFEVDVINTYAVCLWHNISAEALKPRISTESHETSNELICTEFAFQSLAILTKRLCELSSPASEILISAAKSHPSVCAHLLGKVVPLLMERVQRSRGLSTAKESQDMSVSWHEDRVVERRSAQRQYAPALASWIELAEEMKCGGSIEYLIDSLVALVLTQLKSSMEMAVVQSGYRIAKSCLNLDESQEKPTGSQKVELVEAAMQSFVIFNHESEDLKNSCCIYVRELTKCDWLLVKEVVLPKIFELMQTRSEVSGFLGAAVHDEVSCSEILPKILELLKTGEIESGISGVESVLKYNETGSNGMGELVWKPVLQGILACAQMENHDENAVDYMAECVQDVFLSLPIGSSSENDCISMAVDILAAQKIDKQIDVVEPILCSVSGNISGSMTSRLLEILDKDNSRLRWQKLFRILSSLANKMHRENSYSAEESLTVEKVVQKLREACSNEFALDKQNAVIQLGWLTRALMLRNFQPTALEYLREIFDCLDDLDAHVAESAVGACACVYDCSVRNLISPEKTRAVATYFHKQRILSQSVPVFLASFETVKHECAKQYYFVVLGQLLKYAPQGYWILEQAQLVPVLIRALHHENDCSETAVDVEQLEPVISALKLLLSTPQAANTLEKHLDTVAERLIELAKCHVSMDLRVQSVECLGLVAIRFAPTLLHPLKKRVLKGLACVLDDHKRLVRKNAAEARNKWCLYA